MPFRVGNHLPREQAGSGAIPSLGGHLSHESSGGLAAQGRANSRTGHGAQRTEHG